MPCSELSYKGNFNTVASCDDKATGSFTFLTSDIKGGFAPYVFSLDGKSFQPGSSFQNLSAGRYELVIKDSKNCTAHYVIQIQAKNCRSIKEYSFTPRYQEKWDIPSDLSRSFVLEIRNAAGNIILKREYNKDSDRVWDGMDQNGNVVASGYYQFIITYLDGNREYETGFVTILN